MSGGNFPYNLTALDANGDGKMDLAVAIFFDSRIFVLLGNGDGTFRHQLEFPINGAPLEVVSGDFNDDGKLDVAVPTISSDQSTGFVSLLLGNGDGTFQPAIQSPNLGTFIPDLTAGDFNHDGKLDLAVVAGPISGPTEVSVLLGRGDGNFQEPTGYSPGGLPSNVTTGDFNRDGNLDLAVAVSLGVSVLLGNSDGTFQPAVNYPTAQDSYSVAAADFNGDGKLDLVVKTNDGSPLYFSILLGNGDGTFQEHVDLVTPKLTSRFVVADFNGDGKLDLATTNGTVFTFLGNGDGTFAKAYGNFPAASAGFGITTADFNGDGRLDLATANQSDNTLTVLPQVVAVLSKTLVNFGKVRIGQKSSTVQVRLTNTGTVPLTITSLAITGSNATDFKQQNNCASSLPPRANCTIQVLFKPTNPGQLTAAVSITDSAATQPQVITLLGSAAR